MANLGTYDTFTSYKLRYFGLHLQNSWKFSLNDRSYIFVYLVPFKHDFAQSVTCLATDACLTANQGVASSIPAWSHTFVEIDHEIISTVILLPSSLPLNHPRMLFVN